MVESIARHLAPTASASGPRRAIGLLSALVGALQAARAVTDPDLSDRILAAAHAYAMTIATAHLPTATPTDQDPMKAFVVTHYGHDGLAAAETPTPTIGPHDVLVDVRAASINPLDKMVRNGEFKQLLSTSRPSSWATTSPASSPRWAPTSAPSRSVTRSTPDHATCGSATFAEHIAIDADDVALKPRSLSFEEAGAVPLVALAAWQALVDVADVQPGQKVLVHAGAGGLGSTVIQLAKHLGAHVATTAHTNDVDKVRGLGADEVIDFTQQDFAASRWPGTTSCSTPSAAANLEKSLTVLKPGGLAISVVGPPDPAFAEAARPAAARAGHERC